MLGAGPLVPQEERESDVGPAFAKISVGAFASERGETCSAQWGSTCQGKCGGVLAAKCGTRFAAEREPIFARRGPRRRPICARCRPIFARCGPVFSGRLFAARQSKAP